MNGGHEIPSELHGRMSHRLGYKDGMGRSAEVADAYPARAPLEH